MIARDPDPVLRRIERDACIACGGLALVASAVSGGRLAAALAVLGGGALIGMSYWAIKRGAAEVTAALVVATTSGAEAAADIRRRQRRLIARVVLLFAGRFALLVLLAYAMIARLRLHPIGLLAGASSIVAAAAVETIRSFARSGRSP